MPYSTLWSDAVQHDIGAERREFAQKIAHSLEREVDVVSVAAISSRPEGTEAGQGARRSLAEVVLVVETMGTQPAFTLAALSELPGVPVVVWCVLGGERVLDAFDHAAIVTEGGTVGTPMLTNVLVRRRVQFQLVQGLSGERETLASVRQALQVGAAATRLRRARIGRVGRPIDGYDCVDADEGRLVASLVGEIVHIEPAEIRRRFLDVDAGSTARLTSDVQSAFDIATDVSADTLSRTMRFAAAIDHLCVEQRLDAGVMNCHVPEIRFSEDVGIAPCFGLGRSTTDGVPWTCAGDLLTVIPMLALKLLGEASIYHELEAFDRQTLEFVIANTGEHDLALAGPERPALVRNKWFAADLRCGACAAFSVSPGPAALVGFTQLDDVHRFIVARGEITGRTWPAVGTVNGAFRFDAGPEAWLRWCESGVNHHSALTAAAAVPKLERLCRLLDAEFLEV